jgi:hypothetical protein
LNNTQPDTNGGRKGFYNPATAFECPPRLNDETPKTVTKPTVPSTAPNKLNDNQ